MIDMTENDPGNIEDALQGMRRAEAPAYLFSSIQGRIADSGRRLRQIPVYKVSLAAAGILLLVTLNVYFATHFNKAKRTDDVQSIAKDYGLLETGNWQL